MKYNDKKTINSYLKQVDKANSNCEYSDFTNNRKSKRSLDRSYLNFTNKVYKNGFKDWWDSIKENERLKVMKDYQSYAKYTRNTIKFDVWIKIYTKIIKPDKLIYRELVINRLLND